MPKGRILIVEDEVATEGRQLERLLTDNGYKVIGIAPTAAKAVELARKKPDVILMDVMMPLEADGKQDSEGGLKAAGEIRRFCDASIVFVTGHRASFEFLTKVHQTDPTAQFLSKPLINQTQTLTTVRLALVKKQGKSIVFVCYARGDEVFKEELLRVLKVGTDIGVEVWDDSRIRLGDRWRLEIDNALERADTAIVLVSVAFMDSRFIRDIELPKLLAKQRRHRLRVIPVFLDDVPRSALQAHGLMDFQGINVPTKPLNRWNVKTRQAKAWVPLCDRLTDDK